MESLLLLKPCIIIPVTSTNSHSYPSHILQLSIVDILGVFMYFLALVIIQTFSKYACNYVHQDMVMILIIW